MTYSQLRADCMYSRISSRPSAWWWVWEGFTFQRTVYSSLPSTKLFTATGNSHAIWDHTVLPATRHRWESRLSPQLKQVLDLSTPEGCKAELMTYVTWKPPTGNWTSTCKSQVQCPTTEPPRWLCTVWLPIESLITNLAWHGARHNVFQ